MTDTHGDIPMRKVSHFKAVIPPLRYLAEQRVVNGESGLGFAPGQPAQVEIDQLDAITALELRLTGEIATGAAPLGTPRDGAPAGLLGQIRWNVNGQDEVNAPSDALDFMGQWDMGVELLERDFPTAAQLAVPASTLPFSFTLRVPMCLRKIAEEHYGLIAAKFYDQLKLFWQFGTLADVVDGAGTESIVAANTAVEVALIRTRPFRSHEAGYGSFIRRAKPVDVTSTQLGFTTRIESGRSYAGIAMIATAGATNALSDAVITGTVEVRRGGRPERRIPVQKLISDNVALLPQGYNRTGKLMLDFVKDGRDVSPSLAKGLYVPKNELLEVLLDVTAGVNSRVTFVPVITQPVRDCALARGRPVENL